MATANVMILTFLTKVIEIVEVILFCNFFLKYLLSVT